VSLETRLATLISAIGADIKDLQDASGGGGGAVSIFDEFREKAVIKEDFITTAHNFGVYTFRTTPSAVVQGNGPDDTSVGTIILSTGTDSDGVISLVSGLDTVQLGRGITRFTARVRIPTLSNSGQQYRMAFGFLDYGNILAFDGVSFFYEESVSANWRCKCASNFTTTTAETSVPVAANTWYRLDIEINAAGTEAKFWINGTLVATITTNIPSGAGRTTGIVCGMAKTAGTTASTCIIDYIAAEFNKTTLR